MGGRDGEDDVAAMMTPLVAGGVLEPLGDDDHDRRRWLDCELCTLVEHRFAETLDPDALSPAERDSWSRVALAPDEHLLDPRRDWYRAGFWLLDGGERAGTIALTTSMLGRMRLDVSSLYVLPSRRSRGVAFRALEQLQATVVAAGHRGIRLATHWTWQATVRRYLFRYRMWAWSFKRSIDFTWDPDLPSHTITVGEREAHMSIDHEGGPLTLLTATRDGARLSLLEDAGALTAVGDNTGFYATSTFAVALALHGWPLLASLDEFRRAAGGDIGGPPVLARKIAIFEWIDRKHGFAVRTPRIPGLPYDEIARELEGPDPR